MTDVQLLLMVLEEPRRQYPNKAIVCVYKENDLVQKQNVEKILGALCHTKFKNAVAAADSGAGGVAAAN